MDLGSLTLKLKAQVGSFIRDTTRARAQVEGVANTMLSAERRFRSFGQQSTAVRDVVREVENLRRASVQLNAVLNSKAAGQFSPQVLAALRTRAREVDGQLGALTGTTTRAGGAFQRLGAMLNPTTLGVSAAIAGFYALGRAVTGSIAAFTQFEREMTRVGAVTNSLGTATFDKLKTTALDLSATTEFTSRQVADAMGFMGMAGFKANEIMAATPAVLQLASAGMLDVARAADITTNIMSGYGLEVGELERANNTLVATFTNSNTSLEMLGQSFKYVGPIAKSAGVEFEELSAAIGLLGNAGVQADMAGTGLRGVIIRLLSPTKKQAQIMKDLGLQVLDATGKLRSLRDIVGQLADSGATPGQIMGLFEQRAGTAMQALVNQGADAIANLRKEILEAGDIAKRIAEAQLNTFDGQIKILKSNVEAAAIEFAEDLVPTLRELIPVISDVATGIFTLARDALPLVTPVLESFRDMLILITGNGNRASAVIRLITRRIRTLGEKISFVLDPLDIWLDKLLELIGLDISGWFNKLEASVSNTGVSFGKVDQSLEKNAQNFVLLKTTAQATGRTLIDVGGDVGDAAENITQKVTRQRQAIEQLLRTLQAAENKSSARSPVENAFVDFQNKLVDAFAKIEAQKLLGENERLRAFDAAILALENTLQNKLITALVDASGNLTDYSNTVREVREQIERSGTSLSADHVEARARQIVLENTPVPQQPHGLTTAGDGEVVSLGGLTGKTNFERFLESLGSHSTRLVTSGMQGDIGGIASIFGTALGATIGTAAGGIIGSMLGSVVGSLIESIQHAFESIAGPEFAGLLFAAVAPVLAAAAAVGVGVVPALASAMAYVIGHTDTLANVQEAMSLMFGKLVEVMEPFAEALLVNTGIASFLFDSLKMFALMLGEVAIFMMNLGLINSTKAQRDQTRDALEALRDYTFDAAYAEAKLNNEREEGVKRLREFNQELKNVPQVFKMARARAEADRGESRTRDMRDFGLNTLVFPIGVGNRWANREIG